MTPEEMVREAYESQKYSQSVTLIIPTKTKLPKGFPRGELLCESLVDNVKCRAVSYDPFEVLAWLNKNELIGEVKP